MNTMTIEETVTEQYARELGEARELLAKAIAERGEDYVYERQDGADDCMYLTYEGYDYDAEYATSTPKCPTGAACLVGYVLVEKGVPLLEIAGVEGNNATGAMEMLGAFENPVIRKALNDAQSRQDAGQPWGEAVAAFERTIEAHERDVATFGYVLGAARLDRFGELAW